ncbi:MAG: hypothetical protein KF729_33640 [Sandaracinaceae bacterium]|nr:hypothetical protein [Sandaracinaceae bacterium]
MRRAALVLALVALGAPAPAVAQPRTHRTGWTDHLTPPSGDVTARDARRFVRQGLFYLLSGLGRGSSLDDAPWRNLERALVRFELARRVLPDDVDLAYYTAVALDRWERPAPEGGLERNVDDAIAAFERVRALDPDYAPARVAFALALLYARRGELATVAAEYERALALDVPEPAWLMHRTYLPHPFEERLAFLYAGVDRSLVHGNLAENHMLLGDLDAAVRHYRLAQSGARDPMSRALALFGLALAQHRAGDAEGALAAAREAIALDPLVDDPEHFEVQDRWGALAVLHHDAVFFEPACEIHAYHAVAYEAFATSRERFRRAGLEAALTSWRSFLVEGGAASRFAAHARAEVARLEAELARAGAPREPAPHPGELGARAAREPWLGAP